MFTIHIILRRVNMSLRHLLKNRSRVKIINVTRSVTLLDKHRTQR